MFLNKYNQDKMKMTCCREVEIFMETITTLEEALERIAELEKENAKLKEEVE